MLKKSVCPACGKEFQDCREFPRKYCCIYCMAQISFNNKYCDHGHIVDVCVKCEKLKNGLQKAIEKLEE